jgi:YfiR/HmsC-like
MPTVASLQRRTPAVRYNVGRIVGLFALLCGALQPLHGADPAKLETFDICVLGKNSFEPALLATVKGESIDGKTIVARNIPSVQEASNCRILFVSAPEENRVKFVLTTIKRTGILTVSDIPGFATQGGMIELVNHEGRIRFVVNLGAVNRGGLTVSSELLKVAVKVVGMSSAPEVGK